MRHDQIKRPDGELIVEQEDGSTRVLLYRKAENHDIINEHLSSHPEIRRGRPVIHGTRYTASLVKKRIDAGWSISEVVEDYPGILTNEQVQAAYDYANNNPDCDQPRTPLYEYKAAIKQEIESTHLMEKTNNIAA